MDKFELGTESTGKLLFKMSLPAIIAQLINVLYNMVDRIYIGRMPECGHLALTGVGVTMPIILLVSAFAALVSMGGAPRASIMMGRQETDTAEKVMGNCFFALIIISVILTAAVLFFGEDLLWLFGASEQTIGFAIDYLNIYALGTIAVQLSLGMNAFITGQGFAKTGMYTVAIGAVLNIILDPIFIFALDMGVRGAALATIISQAVSAIWVIWFLSGEKTHLKLKRQYFKIERSILVPCLLLGLSPFIMQSTESILMVTFNTSLQNYGGDLAVGAMTIMMSVMQFSMLPLVGLTQGSQPIISYNYGAGNLDRVRKAFRQLLCTSMVYSVSLWLFIMMFPQIFAGLFTNNPELIRFTAESMRLYMAVSLLFGIQISCQNTFIALGNAKASIFLALLRKVILLIPLILILPQFLPDQVSAVFLAEPVADLIAVCVTATLFTIQFKKLLSQEDRAGQRTETSMEQAE
ncbi:MAG: MATE family efflux transporter [Clostridia bacterium]|nr:MATE family efflux transporter [Clostridia bacterium]